MLASIRRPELFSKLILICSSPRYLNDGDSYRGGFEARDMQMVFSAMEANYKKCVRIYKYQAVGASPDMPNAVDEFSKTLSMMRPDICLFVCRTVFPIDLRGILGLVKVPCYIMQTASDPSVPASVATYMKDHLGGRSTVVWLDKEGHLPHLTAPSYFAQKLQLALRMDEGH